MLRILAVGQHVGRDLYLGDFCTVRKTDIVVETMSHILSSGTSVNDFINACTPTLLEEASTQVISRDRKREHLIRVS